MKDLINKSIQVEINKIDETLNLVEGVVYRPSKEFDEDGNPTDYVDSHGDWMTAEDVVKACHSFSKKVAKTQGAVVDVYHQEVPGYGNVVENYIAKTDIPDRNIKEGDWVAVVEVTCEDTWDSILKGDIAGFSIGGKAIKL